MKNLRKLLFVALFAFVFVPKSFALVCEESQALNGGDQCFTKVTLSSRETTLVSEGHVLVYDLDALTPYQAAYQVRLNRASADATLAAGVALGPIKSGDTAMILVRGFGNIRTTGGVVSGDNLFVTASSGQAGNFPRDNFSADPVAVAYANDSNGGTQQLTKAYIKIK